MLLGGFQLMGNWKLLNCYLLIEELFLILLQNDMIKC